MAQRAVTESAEIPPEFCSAIKTAASTHSELHGGRGPSLRCTIAVLVFVDGRIRIENLRPSSNYTLSVRAKNEVGLGPAINLTVSTDNISTTHTQTTSSSLHPPSERSETGGYTVLLAFPSVRPSVRLCALIFRCKYLKKRFEIDAWYQLPTNRKWPMVDRMMMSSMTSRDLQRSRS